MASSKCSVQGGVVILVAQQHMECKAHIDNKLLENKRFIHFILVFEYILNTFLIYNCIVFNIKICIKGGMAKHVIRINVKGEDGYRIISVRIKEGLLQKIDNMSARSNRSRNELINIILEQSVDSIEFV